MAKHADVEAEREEMLKLALSRPGVQEAMDAYKTASDQVPAAIAAEPRCVANANDLRR